MSTNWFDFGSFLESPCGGSEVESPVTNSFVSSGINSSGLMQLDNPVVTKTAFLPNYGLIDGYAGTQRAIDISEPSAPGGLSLPQNYNQNDSGLDYWGLYKRWGNLVYTQSFNTSPASGIVTTYTLSKYNGQFGESVTSYTEFDTWVITLEESVGSTISSGPSLTINENDNTSFNKTVVTTFSGGILSSPLTVTENWSYTIPNWLQNTILDCYALYIGRPALSGLTIPMSYTKQDPNNIITLSDEDSSYWCQAGNNVGTGRTTGYGGGGPAWNPSSTPIMTAFVGCQYWLSNGANFSLYKWTVNPVTGALTNPTITAQVPLTSTPPALALLALDPINPGLSPPFTLVQQAPVLT